VDLLAVERTKLATMDNVSCAQMEQFAMEFAVQRDKLVSVEFAFAITHVVELAAPLENSALEENIVSANVELDSSATTLAVIKDKFATTEDVQTVPTTDLVVEELAVMTRTKFVQMELVHALIYNVEELAAIVTNFVLQMEIALQLTRVLHANDVDLSAVEPTKFVMQLSTVPANLAQLVLLVAKTITLQQKLKQHGHYLVLEEQELHVLETLNSPLASRSLKACQLDALRQEIN